jgi:hypothetical protein
MEGKLSEGAGKREAGFTGHNSIFPPKICCLKRRVKPSKLQVFTRKKRLGKTGGNPPFLFCCCLLITCFYLR